MDEGNVVCPRTVWISGPCDVILHQYNGSIIYDKSTIDIVEACSFNEVYMGKAILGIRESNLSARP